LTLDSLATGASAGLPIAVDKPFQISGDVGFSAAGGEVNNLTIALEDISATGSAKFAPGSPAKVEAKLGLNRLDLDKLLASMSAPGASNAAPPEAARTGGFTLPQDIDASLAVAVAAISYRGGVINDARMVGELSDGKVKLSEFSALLPGGSSFSVA